MFIEAEIHNRLLNAFPAVPPEAGAIIGSVDGIICAFAYDEGASRSDRAIYSPNVDSLNRIIEEWAIRGIEFCGIVHSHPSDQRSLSESDRQYIVHIMQAMPPSVGQLFFPLVFPGDTMLSFSARNTPSKVSISTEDIIIK